MRHTRIIVTHYGGPDALEVLEEECPEPARDAVRVKVLAAGVALPDLLAREGLHPETPRLPFTPGWDLVGVVDRLGPGVSGIEPGQIVAALPISGAYAEFVCLPQRELYPVPSGLDAAEAVCLVLNYVTAYQMLHRSAKVRRGQRVLIHGAAGGSARPSCSSGAWPAWSCMGPVQRKGRRRCPAWAVSRSTTGSSISSRRCAASRAAALTSSLTASGAPTSGVLARLSALVDGWWPMASRPRSRGSDRPRAVHGVVIDFAASRSSGCTSRAAGSCRAGDA